MTDEEIIQWAIDHNIEFHPVKNQVRVGLHALLGVNSMAALHKLCEMAAAAEREACAVVCDDRAGAVSMFGTAKECAAHNGAIDECAAAIRARGKA